MHISFIELAQNVISWDVTISLHISSTIPQNFPKMLSFLSFFMGMRGVDFTEY